MKLFRIAVLGLLVGCVAGLGYHAYKIEDHAVVWQQRIKSAESEYQKARMIHGAQRYSQELLRATSMLANENGILCEREVKMVAYMTAVEEENTLLKESLKDSVINLELQIEEINQLHEELSRAYYQVQTLEAAMKLVPTVADDEDIESVRNDILDILDVLDTVNTVLNILPVIL